MVRMVHNPSLQAISVFSAFSRSRVCLWFGSITNLTLSNRDFFRLLRPGNSKPVKRYDNDTSPQLLKERTTLSAGQNVFVGVHFVRCIASYPLHG